MPAIDTAARTFASAQEMVSSAREVRQRLRGFTAPPPRRPTPEPEAPVPAEVVPVASPLAAPAASLVDQIVAAVCAALGATREALFCDVGSGQLATGRKVALGFMAMRLGASDAVIASHFAVLPAVVREAARRVRDVLVRHAMPLGAPLDRIIGALLADLEAPEAPAPRATVGTIKRAVCEEYSLTQLEMESDTRVRAITRPRMIAMALARRYSGRSLPFIGGHFGNRDHTTVLHACRRADPYIAAALATLPESASLIELISAVRKAWDAAEG